MIFFYTTPLFKGYIKEAGKLLASWVRSKKTYFIYGAGDHSLFLGRSIKLSSPFFLGFIDQSEARQKEGFLGHRVFDLSQAIEASPSGILVSSYEYQEEIVAHVKKTAPHINCQGLYNKQTSGKTGETRSARPLTAIQTFKKRQGQRIAVVDTFFSWPPGGGSSVDLAELMNSLTLKGFDITFFLPYLENRIYFPRGRIFSMDGLRFNISNIVFSQKEFNENTFVSKLGDAVEAASPDYVFLGDMYAFKPSLLSKLKRYKTILRSYNYDLICPRMNLVNREGAPCPLSFLEAPDSCRECICDDTSLDWNHPIFTELRLAEVFSGNYHKKVLRALDEAGSIIVYNSILKERIEKFLNKPEKIKVLPTGIFPEKFSVQAKRKSSEDITILLPGRAEDPAKGFPFYLGVFQKLRKTYKGITLLITGRFDPHIEGVRSAGWLPPEEAVKLYKQADFCVIPSLWEEPFGIVALEAMASEIPVIASSVGGLKEIVRDSRTGFLAPPGDSNAFFKLSETLILNAGLRERLGREGAMEAEKYSWSRVVDRYLIEVYS